MNQQEQHTPPGPGVFQERVGRWVFRKSGFSWLVGPTDPDTEVPVERRELFTVYDAEDPGTTIPTALMVIVTVRGLKQDRGHPPEHSWILYPGSWTLEPTQGYHNNPQVRKLSDRAGLTYDDFDNLMEGAREFYIRRLYPQRPQPQR